MKRLLLGLLALVLLAAAGAVGYAIGDHGNGTVPSSSESLTGVYYSGALESPHYYAIVTEKKAGHVSGTIDFRYQDGQSAVILRFVGTPEDGESAMAATLVTKTASTRTTVVPSTLSVTWGTNEVVFGECTGYLHYTTSESTCYFQRARGSTP